MPLGIPARPFGVENGVLERLRMSTGTPPEGGTAWRTLPRKERPTTDHRHEEDL
jgi:hypothetical protein